jgi:aminoglycoside phosphotransferase (APT) family kinase protein
MTETLEAAELIDQRPDERLDTARLEPWLRTRLPGAEGPLSVRQFGGGKANLTYLLQFGDPHPSLPREGGRVGEGGDPHPSLLRSRGRVREGATTNEFVLRRPPLGPVAPGAHDMRREHRVLSVLHRRYPLAPPSLVLCEDESVIGAVFHVLERRRGFVIWEDMPPEFAGRPELNRRIGFALVDALADLHRVDPAAVGLDALGRPEGYLARQLDGWTRRWHAALDLPAQQPMREAMAPVLVWLERHLPDSGRAALLHNDYRLDNVLLDPADPARVVAVLDWDMCTQGDPLADLGYLLNYWVEPGDDPAWREIAAMPTWRTGFPSRAEATRRYSERTGFAVAAVRWYEVFAAFKLAVIIQQIYIRWRRGQTQDLRFHDYGDRAAGLAAKARVLAGLAG